MIFIMLFLPFLTIIALSIHHMHLLMTLLILEGLTLSLVLLIPLSLIHMTLNLKTLTIVILCLGACEASLGLSLLVFLSRTSGSDLMKSLTVNKC